MQNQLRSVARVRYFRCSVAILAVGATLALAACSSSTKSTVASNGSTTAAPAGSTATKGGRGVILKHTTNPFFVSMQKSAETEAAKVGVKLTVSAGKADGDEQTQITAIENSISAG